LGFASDSKQFLPEFGVLIDIFKRELDALLIYKMENFLAGRAGGFVIKQ
jgi:hypothetical protein